MEEIGENIIQLMLQIYFQSGTFESGEPSFWSDLFISSLGALIGIAGAYLIYLVSVNQVRNDRLKYTVALINSVIPSALKQAEYCDKHAEHVLDNPLAMPLLKIEANRDLKRLADKVDQEGVYHAFLAKYGRKSETYLKFQRVYAAIDFLEYSLTELIISNEKIITAAWERKKKYAIAFRQVKEKVESLIIDPELKAKYSNNISFYSETLKAYFEKNPLGENVVYSYSSLIIPLRDYIIANGPVIQQNTELMFLLNEVANQYRGMEMSGNHYSNDYKVFSADLNNGAKQLREETNELRNDYS